MHALGVALLTLLLSFFADLIKMPSPYLPMAIRRKNGAALSKWREQLDNGDISLQGAQTDILAAGQVSDEKVILHKPSFTDTSLTLSPAPDQLLYQARASRPHGDRHHLWPSRTSA